MTWQYQGFLFGNTVEFSWQLQGFPDWQFHGFPLDRIQDQTTGLQGLYGSSKAGGQVFD